MGLSSGINLWKVIQQITLKTKNTLDPTALLLGIYPTDIAPCAQNNMYKDTSYSIICQCKLTKKDPIVSQ